MNDRAEGKARISDIVKQQGLVVRILQRWLHECKQTPKGPWNIFGVLRDDEDQVDSSRPMLELCTTIDDLFFWLLNLEIADCDCRVHQNMPKKMASVYDDWKHGFLDKEVDCIQCMFQVVFEALNACISNHMIRWTHVMLEESTRVLTLDRDTDRISIRDLCVTCNENWVDTTTWKGGILKYQRGRVQCRTCQQNLLSVFCEEGELPKDLSTLLHSYLFLTRLSNKTASI